MVGHFYLECQTIISNIAKVSATALETEQLTAESSNFRQENCKPYNEQIQMLV